jgi:pimeloyl-ACP methyl ester carboxylesterase
VRVLFVHGLMSSPEGTKACYLAERFDARTPAMDTSDFPACVDLQRRTIEEFQPRVVVGSSFGGAVVVELLRSGAWQGPTLLLAQAALKMNPEAVLPPGADVILVHGSLDTVVDPQHSRTLAATSGSARLIEIEDEHRLVTLTEGERLAELVTVLGAP